MGLGSFIPLIGPVLDAGISVYNTERTISSQKKLAEYAYQKDLEMWNRANMYNSPEMQMQRLRSAGLNPNLVYGSGSVHGNTSTQTPKYQMYDTTYRYQMPRVTEALGILSQFQDYKIKKGQSEGVALKNAEQAIINDFLSSKLYLQNQSLRLGLDLRGQQIAKNLVESEYWAQNADLKNRMLEFDLKSMLPAKLGVYNAQIGFLKEQSFNKFLENELFSKTGMGSGANWIAKMFGVQLNKKYPNLFTPMR